MINLHIEGRSVTGSIDGKPATEDEIAEYITNKLTKRFWRSKVKINFTGKKEDIETVKKISKKALKTLKPFAQQTIKRHKGIDKKRNAGADVTVRKVDIQSVSKKHIKGNGLVPHYKSGTSHLLLLPGFAVTFDSTKNYEAKTYNLSMHKKCNYTTPFKDVPRNVSIIDTTWAKLNRNGTRDKRFKGNYKLATVTLHSLNFGTIFPNVCSLYSEGSSAGLALGLFKYSEPDLGERIVRAIEQDAKHHQRNKRGRRAA